MANNINCTCGHSWSKASSSKKDMYVCHMCGKDNTMKDGGWLDNYGKKPNPNDVEVSVGPGYVGLGYDITGRNYSPAWGGQFEDGGNVAQGGKSIPVPTTADSARLYNAQIALNNFYAKEMKAGRIKRDLESEETFLPEIFPKGHTNNLKYLNQDNLDFYREKLAERDRFKGRGKFDDEYAEYFGLSSKQVNDLEKKGLGQTKGSSEYQKYYRDLITPMQNLAAPFALIDTRIAPRKTMYYYPTVGGYPGGDVMVYDYDPLAIKPYYARTDKEKLAWEKKYGKGTPTTSSTKKPTTSTEKSKTEPGKKKTAIVKKSEETKTKLIKPTESTKLTETKETKLTKPTKTEEIKPTPYTPTGSKKYILNGMEVSEEDFLGSGNTTGGSKRIIYSTPKIKDRKVLRLDGTPETDPEKIRKAMRAQEKNDDMAMGGSIPGAVGFTYARTAGSAPSNGKYAKKTKASAQNGKEMKFYQEGLDFKPNSIAQDGAIVDPMGQWAHPGEVTIIPSTDITMEGVDYPVLGISDTGDQQMMYPGEDYDFDGEYVTEYPMMQDGGWLNKFDQGKASSDATRVAAPVRPLTKEQQKENVRINKQTQKNTEEYNKALLADRKSRRETKGDVNVPGSFNIAEKLRFAPNSPGGWGQVFDEYINPAFVVGTLADALGESTAAKDPKAVAATLAMTAGLGALGFDPLGSSIKSTKKIGKHLTEKTALKRFSKFSGVRSLMTKPKSISPSYVSPPYEKSGFNPLGLVDDIAPRIDPIKAMGVEMDIMDLSPLNLIPGYGRKLSGKNQTFRKFGNSLDDVVERQALSPAGGSKFRMGKDQITSEGNWAAKNQPSENYPGVFEATFDMNNPNANLSALEIPNRNGVLMVDKAGRTLPEIPLTEPGMSFNRRLPFSTRYVPIDKQKLMNNEFQFATMAPRLQSLAEKYTLGLGAASVLGKEARDTYNKYTIDPVIDMAKKLELEKLGLNVEKRKDGGWLSKFDTAQGGGTFMDKVDADIAKLLGSNTDKNRSTGDMASYFPEIKRMQEKPKNEKAIIKNEQEIKKQRLAEAVANAKGKQATVKQDNRTSREKEIAQKKLLDLKMAEAKSTSPFTQTLSSFTPTGSNQAAGQIAAENIGQMTPMMGATRLFTTLTDPENNPYGIGQGNGFLANTLGTLGLLGDAFDVGAITNPAIASGLKRFTNKPSPKVNQLDNSGKFATEIVDPETGISKFVYELDNNPVANNYQPAKGSDFTGFQVKLYDKAKEISNAILDAFTNTSNYNKPLTSLESYKNWAKFIHPELEFVDPKIIKEIHKEGIKTLKKTGSLPKGEDASRQLGLYIRDRLADKIPSFADPVVTHPTTGKFMTYGPNQLHPNVLSKDELSIFEQIYKGDEQSGLHPQYRDLSTVPVKDWGYDINKLSAQELNLIDAYAHGYDQIMNARGSNQNVFNTSKFYQDKVEQLNQAIQKNKFPEATFVRRGANDYQVELLDPITYQPTGKLVSKNELKVGDVFKDEEFLSTSIGQEHAIGTPTASELVEIPGGGVQSYAYPNAASPSKYPNELEAILPKGLIRRVEEVRSPSSVDEFSNVKYPNNAKYRTKILNPYNLLLPLGGAALFGKEKKENGGWLTKYK